jgi:hypothetical protein
LDELRLVLALGPDEEASWLSSRAYLQQGALDEAFQSWDRAGGYGRADPTAPEAAHYVGSARCAECHAAIYQAQQSSRHARTFLRGPDLAKLPLPDRDVVDVGDSRVVHTIRQVESWVRMETLVGEARLRAWAEYALGSGKQGVTLVGRDESGTARELRLSYYPDLPHWDKSPAQRIRPPDAGDFLGRPLTPDMLRSCLHCHTTTYRAALDPARSEARDRGIGCERCHGPGGNHLRAVAARFPDPAIAQPRLASAEQRIALCGQCHRAPVPTGMQQPSIMASVAAGPLLIRFQMNSLVLSRCVTESRGTFDCMNCHSPHRDAESSPTFYECKCLSCHGATPTGPPLGHPAPPRAERPRVACRINPGSGCLECHMPKVPDAGSRAVFTDHFIRVRRPPAPSG